MHIFAKDFGSCVLSQILCFQSFSMVFLLLLFAAVIFWWFAVLMLNITPSLEEQGTPRVWLQVGEVLPKFPRLKCMVQNCGITTANGNFAIVFSRTVISLGMINTLTSVKILEVKITNISFSDIPYAKHLNISA